MKPKHSPAPWKSHNIPGMLFEIDSTDGPVLRIRGGMVPTDHNAQLIEAAPELLAVLQEMTDELDVNYMQANKPKGPTERERIRLIRQARKAIARAEGRS